MRRALLAATTGVIAASIAALPACGDSSYEYLSNQKEKVFFKIPDRWTIYEEGDLGLGEGIWFRGFDASPQADPAHVLSDQHDQPRGFATVSELSGEERDVMSFALLRSLLYQDEEGNPVDPVTAYAEDEDGRFQVLDYEELSDDAARGIHLRVLDRQSGDGVVTDLTVLVDQDTSRRYVLTMGCTSECWLDNEKTFEEVIESWTVQERS
jgi:hypothetical protein